MIDEMEIGVMDSGATIEIEALVEIGTEGMVDLG